MPPEPAITIDKLTVRLDDRPVLDGLSLHVARDEKVVLRGRSGSGKTTVLRCVLGFVEPDAGEVRVLGKPVTAETVWEVRRRVAYVAQEPDLGEGTVRETLERPFTYRANADCRDNLLWIGDLFARFLLPESLLEKDVDTLSGGEKQRVGLVAALLLDRPVLLLDEASSALDDDSARAIGSYLAERDDLGILAVAHDAVWTDLADRLVDLPAGGAAANGGPT